MNPLLQMTALCLSTMFLLTGCPDSKTPAPPLVPQPKANLSIPPSPAMVVSARGLYSVSSTVDALQPARKENAAHAVNFV